MQRCFDKYGEESFEIELFETCDISQLDEREQYWIDAHFGDKLCLNMNQTASKPPNAKGRVTSDETKLKISKANKGRKHTNASKSLMSEAAVGHKRWLGKHHTQESKEKISKANESTIIKHLMSPNGDIVKFCNTTQFCEQNGLDKGAVYRVLNNKARSHQGWTKI